MKMSLRTKAIFVILVFTLVLSVSTVLVSYNTYTKSFNEHYETLASSVAKSTASVVDTEQVKR